MGRPATTSLLPSLLLGESGSSPEAAEWGRKHLPFEVEKGNKEATIFERNSPRAVKVLRSLIMTFLSNDDSYSLRKKIDLNKYSELAGQSISNAALHELCSMRPDIVSLNLSTCVDVDDVGLWAVARHAPLVRELFLRGLYRVSAVGLRSLALRCIDLRVLDLTGCHQLDDLAMKPLALFKRLEYLCLRECTSIGDVGVVDALGGAEKLVRLDLRGCLGIKNFRDLILLKVAQCCPFIEVLLMPQAKFVGDRGLRGLSLQSPPRLHTLALGPCDDVTGVGLKALTRLAPSLTDLSLSHTKSPRQSELCTFFSSLTNLTSLSFTDSEDVGTAAIATLVASASKLKHLDLHNGTAVKDQTLHALFPARHVLEDLNVANCPAVTKEGIERLCSFWTSLHSLNINGVSNLNRLFLLDLVRRLPFAMLADTYTGLKAKPDALRSRGQSRDVAAIASGVVRMQAVARRMHARAKVVIARREWVTQHRLLKAQALIRGHIARVKYVEMQHELICNRAALRVQRVWKGFTVRREWKEYYVQRKRNQDRLSCIMLIQRTYRGHRGRMKVTKRRNANAVKELEEAQLQAAMEVYASRIQKPYRARMARKRVAGIRAAKQAEMKEKMARVRGATGMQKVWRGFKAGRKPGMPGRTRSGTTNIVTSSGMARNIMEWQSARRIQTRWRIVIAKRILDSLREEARLLIELKAVGLLQRAWRGGRGRYVALIQKKLAKTRSKENKAATNIQRAFRGDRARKHVQAHREARAKERRENTASRLIQKIYRGHKGRERAEVERSLDDARSRAKPLFEKQAQLNDQLTRARDAHTRHSKGWEIFTADIKKFDEEIKSANASSALWTDSSRIHGVPQRYLTRYLRVKLEEERQRKELILHKLKAKVAETFEACHDMERQLRVLEREITPLIKGVQQRIKETRTKRLRDYVRSRYRAARSIQRVYRGWIVRKAMFSCYRDYWVQCMDDATDTIYFFNTWSQETRWSQPYEMVVSKAMQGGKDGMGSNEDLPEGWVRKKDPTLKLQYYYHEAKHEFRWESPAVMQVNSSHAAVGGRDQAKIYDDSWFNRQNKAELMLRSQRTRPIGMYWEERRDPETAVTFYVQPVTKETRWSLSPRSAIAEQTDSQQAIEYSLGAVGGVGSSSVGDASGWVKVVDTSGGGAVEYYYNSVTGQSQWERPVGYADVTW